jgi:hypothetical protein
VLSIEAPRRVTLETPMPDKGLAQGEPVWESMAVAHGLAQDPLQPVHYRFYFKEGGIRAVDRMTPANR